MAGKANKEAAVAVNDEHAHKDLEKDIASLVKELAAVNAKLNSVEKELNAVKQAKSSGGSDDVRQALKKFHRYFRETLK